MTPKSEEIKWEDIQKDDIIQTQTTVSPRSVTLGSVISRAPVGGIVFSPYLILSHESIRDNLLGFHNAIYMLSVISDRNEGHNYLIDKDWLNSSYSILRWKYDEQPRRLIHPDKLVSYRDDLLNLERKIDVEYAQTIDKLSDFRAVNDPLANRLRGKFDGLNLARQWLDNKFPYLRLVDQAQAEGRK